MGTFTNAATVDLRGEVGLAPPYRARDFAGSFGEYIETLWWQYLALVDEPSVELWGKPVRAFDGTCADGRDACFWHLVTSSDGRQGVPRRLDLARCAALPQGWDLLERLSAGDPRACHWRQNKTTIVVAAVDFSLQVVLRETQVSWLVVTLVPGYTARARRKLFRRAAKAVHVCAL